MGLAMGTMRFLFTLGFVLMGSCLMAQIPKPAAPETGDLHRQYFFEDAKENIPYRLYVPASYDGSKAYPLVVVLHGSSRTPDYVFDQSDLRAVAESKGVILVAPMGYNSFGGYGDIYPVVVTHETGEAVPALLQASGLHPDAAKKAREPQHPAAPDDYFEVPANQVIDARTGPLSEKDVMNVLALVRKEYRIDPARIYLMGNSMGGVGTAYLAAKYPEIWAAISPSGGPIAVWSYPYFRLRDHKIAALFVHGDSDEHANWKWSEAIVRRAKLEGVDAELLLVPNGTHVGAWEKVVPQIFDFFLKHRKE